MSFKDNLIEKFQKAKCFSFRDPLMLLPIYNDGKELIGFLKPITKHFSLTDPTIAALLTKWRIENPTLSTGKFVPTEEKTKTWIDNLILKRDDRMLFMIIDLKNNYLGHIGFSNFRYEDAVGEVDSVCRGVQDVHPGLMAFAMKALMSWGYGDLQMSEIELSVYDDNVRAIDFYKRFGFEISIKKPLYKTVVNGEEKLEIAPEDYSGPVEKYYLVMKYIADKDM